MSTSTYISNFLNDHKSVAFINQLINTNNAFLEKRSPILRDILPIHNYEDTWHVKSLLSRAEIPVASIVGIGQEIPERTSGTFTELDIEMPKIANAIHWNEDRLGKLKEFFKATMKQGVSYNSMMEGDPYGMAGTYSTDFARHIFGSTQQLMKSVVDGVLLLAWDAVQTCEVNLEYDKKTSLTGRWSYRRPDTNYNFYPAPLTATGATGDLAKTNKWTDYTNANGLQNIYDLGFQMFEENGMYPDYCLMSTVACFHLRQQQSTKDAAVNFQHVWSNAGVVNEAMVQTLIDAVYGQKGPQIVIVNDRYQYETETGIVKEARFLKDNQFVLCYSAQKSKAELAIGALLENNQGEIGGIPYCRSGMYVKHYDRPGSPPVTIQEAAMRAFPVIPDDRFFGSQQVF
jgi:hypothetical protein